MKKCCKCKEYKEIKNFSPDKKGKFGIGSTCKKCSSLKAKNYSRTKNGVITSLYSHQRSHSIDRNMPLPKYTRDELKEWAFNQKIFHVLYDNWVQSGYQKSLKPSVDRIDDYIGYEFKNIQLMTWEENDKKGSCNIKAGLNNKISKAVLQYSKDGVLIAEYHSVAEAGRKTPAHYTNISAVCNGKLKSTGGFVWKFK